VIETRNLTYSYHGSGGAAVLRDVSLRVEPGSLLCLAGANGSGKSTLLCLLAGLYAPGSGRVRVAGVETPGQEQALRRAAALVLQEADLQIVGATVREDLFLGLERDDAAGREQALAQAGRLGLDALLDSPVQTLSHGQKRKLCLATALQGEPRVLLLDEPMSGLDYPGIREMRAILARNKEQGLTQVVSAHDLEPLADLADRLAVLERGRLVLEGPPQGVLDRVADHGVRPPCSWRAGRGVTPWA
jgi:biotin transport system ATP-binding protein